MTTDDPHNAAAATARRAAMPVHHTAIDNTFWTPRLAMLRTTTLDDVFSKFEQDGAFANFDRVAHGETSGHHGFPWFDGLIYETIRAAADFLATAYDQQLDARIDGYIERIGAAQAADAAGYLNSYVTLTRPATRWGAGGGDQLYSHEEYNAGCLVEAAVHHYRATGKTTLLTIAVRFATYMCDLIGPAPKHNIVPSHALPEEAFLKLYHLLRATPELAAQLGVNDPAVYRELVQFWIDHRGNHHGRTSFTEYAQDHKALIEQNEAVGHAVRATLLYAGLAALANDTGVPAYHQAAARLWRDVVERKMYLTGGVGAIDQYEGFSFGYYLPSDGYNETCAAVGLAFWAGHMHQAHPHAQYAAIVERVIYNSVLAGVSLNGTAYSYQNPLVNHGTLHRWGWHSCPCCPPMLLKLYASLGELVYAHDGQHVYINQYIGSTARIPLQAGDVTLALHSDLPWHGAASATLHMEQPQRFDLHFRVPDWCPALDIQLNGQPHPAAQVIDGYAVLQREWRDGDTVALVLAMPIQRIVAHPFVAQLREQVALQRGPLIYCVEGVDHQGAAEVVLDADAQLRAEARPELLGGVMTIVGRTQAGGRLCAVPYYAWDNRTTAAAADDWMAVWLKQPGSHALRQQLDGAERSGWEHRLYRPLAAD